MSYLRKCIKMFQFALKFSLVKSSLALCYRWKFRWALAWVYYLNGQSFRYWSNLTAFCISKYYKLPFNGNACLTFICLYNLLIMQISLSKPQNNQFQGFNWVLWSCLVAGLRQRSLSAQPSTFEDWMFWFRIIWILFKG